MKVLLLLLPFFQPEFHRIHLEGHAQGTTWMVNYYSPDSTVGKSQIDSIFNKIDSSLSVYKSYSLISRFNTSDNGLKADEHFINVIKKSVEVFRETKGAFDITYKSTCAGTDKLSISGNTVVKKQPCVIIDVNGIAQGYTVDIIADYLSQKGIKNFIVEVGGEIRISGHRQPSGEPMKVEIQSPIGKKMVSFTSGAVTTSSNYEKNHIIDPSSGEPVNNELVSVTVYAKDAMTADGYDNAFMVMGLKKSMKFIRRRKDMAAYFVYRTADGYAARQTKRFTKLLVN